MIETPTSEITTQTQVHGHLHILYVLTTQSQVHDRFHVLYVLTTQSQVHAHLHPLCPYHTELGSCPPPSSMYLPHRARFMPTSILYVLTTQS